MKRLRRWIRNMLIERRYRTIRRLLICEMIDAGWRQDPDSPERRLVHDGKTAEGLTGRFRVNMADHEAVSRHFKEHPLRAPVE